MFVNRMIILPLVGQFACYSLMVLVLPAILFKHKLGRYSLAARVMIYQLIGNFYLMNLVFILQLLHICNPVTMWIVTVIFIVVLMLKKKRTKLFVVLDSLMEYMRRLLTGVIGKRSLGRKVSDYFIGIFKDWGRWLKRYFLPHILEWALLGTLLVYLFYLRGQTYFETYGYYYSDLMVHTYWVNGLSQGKLFIAGIYPYGYHNIMYALHAMFGLETINIFRLFGLVQTVYVFINLFAFLRGLSKTWFAPFFGLVVFCGWNLWAEETLQRFSSPLPQEYGYVFLLPVFFFAILFLKERGLELKVKKDALKAEKEKELAFERAQAAAEAKEVDVTASDGIEDDYPVIYKGTGTDDDYTDAAVETVAREDDYPVTYRENGAEDDYPVTYRENGAEDDYPMYYEEGNEEGTPARTAAFKAAEDDYPMVYEGSGEDDYPAHYDTTEDDYPAYFEGEDDDYPVTYQEDGDYPVRYEEETKETEDDYPVKYDENGDYPVYFKEEKEGAEDDYPAHYEEGKETDEGEGYPVEFTEDDYRFIPGEEGDFVYFKEEGEEELPNDWASITQEVLAPKQRELTEDERIRYERMKRWHGTFIYKLYLKMKPKMQKAKDWVDRRKVHPIQRFVAWCKSMSASTQNLLLFAMAFSMTISAHFYVTIAAGIGCVGLALAFFIRFFRWKYLKSVLLSLLVSLMFALYPMVIAYIGGTPLQGSMYWAMSVMRGDEGEDERVTSQTLVINGMSIAYSLGEGQTEADVIAMLEKALGEGEVENIEGFQPAEEEEELGRVDKLKGIMDDYVFNEDMPGLFGFSYVEIIFALIAAGLVLGLLACFKDSVYGRSVFAMALYAAFLVAVFIMGDFGLPQLMDESRNREFFAYSLAVCVGLGVDAAVYLLLGWRKTRLLMQGASLALLAGTGFLLYTENQLKWDPMTVDSLQTNGAMVTTLSIMDEYPDFHWTIVTPNDEIRMVEEHGRHTETITFLRSMEDFDANSSEMFLPTDYVFFYIEKIPKDYDEPYEGSGQSVSEIGASRSLPKGNRVSEVYSGEARWITMSHMYYWAQKFMELFPNEMEVLYEDDEFVSYKVKQNPYSLYNFAINYGYNAKSSTDHRRRRSEG